MAEEQAAQKTASDDAVRHQVDGLDLDRGDLIVCDVDEVVLHFLKPFRNFLQENGYSLAASDFSLNNNVLHEKRNEPAGSEQVFALIQDFFRSKMHSQTIVEGAGDTLHSLSGRGQVILLTNIPHELGDIRRQVLKACDVPFPIITNEGAKGPVVAALAQKAAERVFFLDDSPGNLMSVHACVEKVHLIHFVADRTFFELAPDLDAVHLKTRKWDDVGTYIHHHLSA